MLLRDVPQDIVDRVARDFGDGSVDFVLTRMLDAVNLLSDKGLWHGPPDRLLRCVVWLSQGSLDQLSDVIELSRVDWRDVISYAEYVPHKGDWLHVRDFNELS